MKYFIETRQHVSIYDALTISEFETFVRKENKTWEAKKGYHDDRVMSMVWALVILNKNIAENYLDIEEYDEAGSPVKISDPNQYLADSGLKSTKLQNARPIGQSIENSLYKPVFDFGINISDIYKKFETQDIYGKNAGWDFL